MTKWATADVPVRIPDTVVAVPIERASIRAVVHVTTRKHQSLASLYPILFLMRCRIPRKLLVVNIFGGYFRIYGNIRKNLSSHLCFLRSAAFDFLSFFFCCSFFSYSFTFPLLEGITGEDSPGPPRNGYFLPRGRPQTFQAANPTPLAQYRQKGPAAVPSITLPPESTSSPPSA